VGADVVRRPAEGSIYVIGDVHGRRDLLILHLEELGLVDSDGRWTGGRSVVVQVGDLLDRGPWPVSSLELMMRLQAEARRSGGDVVALAGNHELMAMAAGAGDEGMRATWLSEANGGLTTFGEWLRLRGVDEEALLAVDPVGRARASEEAFESLAQGFFDEFAPSGRYGRWLGSNHPCCVVGDTVFVHAGLAGPFARPVEEVDSRWRSALSDGAFSDPVFGSGGPAWVRHIAEHDVGTALSANDASRMVVGHCPSPTVDVAYGGLLVNVDVGMVYWGTTGALEIRGDEMWVRRPGRPPHRIK